MQRRPSLFALSLALALALLHAPSATAQCDPRTEYCDPAPPSVAITPGSTTTDSMALTVRVHWIDTDGLGGSTYSILVNGIQQDMGLWGFQLNETGTRAVSERRVSPYSGPVTVVARITDAQGNEGEGTATYTYVGPGKPEERIARDSLRIFMTPHHNHYRDVSIGSASLAFATPAYTSMGQARSYGAVYLSGQAYPRGFVQVDVADLSLDPADVYSLQLRDFQTNAPVTLHNGQQEMFFSGKHFPQRLAAQWDMRTMPTGDYKYWVVARAYWDDGSFKESHALARVLVINESGSPFGRGWSMPGLQRIRNGRYGDGVMLVEGNGKAWFFEAGPCDAQRCTYRTPEGEFSTLEKLTGGGWVRRYPDGSRADFWASGAITTFQDRFANLTWYDWGANNGVEYPTGIRDPAGKLLVFNRLDTSQCTGCRIAALASPEGRVTSLSHDAAGNLVAAMNPDSSYQFRDATYTTASMLTGWKDTRGGQWNVGYSWSHLYTIDAPAVTIAGTSVRPRTGIRAPQVGAMRLVANTTLAAPAPAVHPDSASAKVVDPEGHTSYTVLDRFGNPTIHLSAAGETSYWRYNSRGLLEATGGTTYIWNDRGELVEQRENGILVMEATYTHFGQPHRVISGADTTRYSYTAAGVLARSWTGAVADSISKGTTYTFDSRGRLTAVASPDGRRSETKYFAGDWMNAEWSRQWKRVGAEEMWVATYYGYDGYSRRYRVHGPDSVTTTQFDKLNRPVRVTDARGGVTTFGYTGPDLVQVTDAGGKVYRWDRDVLGRVTVETDPEGRTRAYSYDRDGLVSSRTDRRGLSVATTYDRDHRVKTLTADGRTTTFSYQLSPQRVVASNDVSTDTLEQHPTLPGPGRSVHAMGGRTFVLRHLVDEDLLTRFGLEVTSRVNGTQAWQHTAMFTEEYDPADAALAYILHLGNFAGKDVALGYDRAGRLTRKTYNDVVSSFHDYDAHRRPTMLNFSAIGLNSSLGGAYEYDYMDRLVRRRNTAENGALTYSYDKLGRLAGAQELQYTLSYPPIPCDPMMDTCPQPDTVATVVRSESFAYDSVGNRTGPGAVRAPNSNRYTTFDGWTLEYDAEGNLTRKYRTGMDQTFTWNALGQLASVTTNGRAIHYRYNGFGTRVKREDPSTGGVVWYLYDGGNLLMELDASGTPFRSYSHAGTDHPLSVTLGNPLAGTTYFYVMDQPGHVTALLDSGGTLKNRYVYRPFGQRQTGTSETVQQPLQFMGRERDEVTGIYYVRNRWYDADLGRFVSEDPIGLAGGINTYTYANNDPINLRDPSGLSPECKSHVSMTWEGYTDLGPEGRQALEGYGICVGLMLEDVTVEAEWGGYIIDDLEFVRHVLPTLRSEDADKYRYMLRRARRTMTEESRRAANADRACRENMFWGGLKDDLKHAPWIYVLGKGAKAVLSGPSETASTTPRGGAGGMATGVAAWFVTTWGANVVKAEDKCGTTPRTFTTELPRY